MSSKRLAGIRNRELWALSAKDQAKVTAALAVGGVREGRGKGGGRQAEKAERVWEEAEARLEAEATVRARQEAQQRTADAEARVARKGRWF